MHHATEATGELFVREAGSGLPLVFLHALGASSRYFALRLGTLPDHARCVLPDLLGFGLSPKPIDGTYTVTDHLDALHAALVGRGVAAGPFVLVGHSLGAILAVEYAAAHPAMVAGLILIGLPYYRSREEAATYIVKHGNLLSRALVVNGRLAWLMCMALHWRPRLSERLAALFVRQYPPDVSVDAVRHRWESYSRTFDRCILNHDLTPALARLRVPSVLALHGTRDTAAPLDAVEELARARGDITVERIAGGHHLFLSANRACVASIQGYVAKLGVGL